MTTSFVTFVTLAHMWRIWCLCWYFIQYGATRDLSGYVSPYRELYRETLRDNPDDREQFVQYMRNQRWFRGEPAKELHHLINDALAQNFLREDLAEDNYTRLIRIGWEGRDFVDRRPWVRWKKFANVVYQKNPAMWVIISLIVGAFSLPFIQSILEALLAFKG